MLVVFAVVASVISGVFTIAVGVRLLLLWRRTREVPELSLSIACLSLALGVLLGTAYAAIGVAGGRAGFEWLVPLRIVTFALAPIALWIGVQRVFRPEARWARALCWLGVLGTVAAMVWRLDLGLAPRRLDFGNVASVAVTQGVFAWAAAESFAYFAAMRKRMALGLADRVTAQQFLCWGVSGLAALASGVVPVVVEMETGVTVLAHPAMALVSTITGLVSTLCLYLSFFPPLFYQRMLRAGDAAPGGV